MSKIPDEIIVQAKAVDIINFLESYGYRFKKEGKHYKCKEHNSLIFGVASNGTQSYVWNSKGEKGDSIDFVIRNVVNGDFRKAIFLLTGWSKTDIACRKEKKLIQTPQNEQVSFNFNLNIAYAKDLRRTFAYLIKTRFIDSIIIHDLVKNKLIAQDEKNNVVFHWFSPNNELKGADLVGTLTQRRFKGTVKDSDESFAFNIPIGLPNQIMIFESNIDLLSFYSMYKSKLNNVLLLSLSGVEKLSKIDTYLIYYKEIKTIYACLDADKAGDVATAKIKQLYPTHTFKDTRNILKENAVKDWNELLLKKS